jgi:hypothetical protein
MTELLPMAKASLPAKLYAPDTSSVARQATVITLGTATLFSRARRDHVNAGDGRTVCANSFSLARFLGSQNTNLGFWE